MRRLFDAFFTTKASGMGMGLPISKTIVEEHNGKIWSSSRLGDGASFFVLLPGAWAQNTAVQAYGTSA